MRGAWWTAVLLPALAAGCGEGGGDTAGDVAGDGADDAPLDPGADGVACAPEPEHSGEATYYDFADGSGNCGFDPTPDDLLVAAMNHTDYAASAVCGGCAHVVGPRGEVTVRLVDRCPECPVGNIDLSPQAFERIAELAAGRVPIRWTYVPCEVDGPIRYHFQADSNPWWIAVQIRNHRHRIARLEYRDPGGSWNPLPREDWNYFILSGGEHRNPLAFRVTDIHGHLLEDDAIAMTPGADVPGSGQFPPCP
ncbi:MAG: hypothetical protein GYA57_17885 [Myxococcales bacterium]|nr:hypothetical protein [Myxococcales bacterium]